MKRAIFSTFLVTLMLLVGCTGKSKSYGEVKGRDLAYPI